MIKIKQLTGTSFETIHGAFANAFSDYVEPFDLTLEQLKYMVERRGCNLELSFGAFSGNELVGLTLNGIGLWKGELTAYDTGTGVVKEFRKQGIATRMFNESLPVLRDKNIAQYLLEVIKSNTSAYELYKKAGFKVCRELDYYKTEKDKIGQAEFEEHNGVDINTIANPDWELFKSFWDFHPSWQNSIDSINRKIDHFVILGVFENDKIIGYGIIEKHTGDIPQLAISKSKRRKGFASKLFYSLLDKTSSEHIKIINTANVYEPFKHYAEKLGIPEGIGQYEMIMKL